MSVDRMRPSCDVQAAEYPDALDIRPYEPLNVIGQWLASFNKAVVRADYNAIASLFFKESFWKDKLILTWEVRTLRGPAAIIKLLQNRRPDLKPPTLNQRKGKQPEWASADHWGHIKCLTAYLDLETELAVGHGIVRLMQDAQTGIWKCFTLYTAASDLKGHEECTRYNRPSKRLSPVSEERSDSKNLNQDSGPTDHLNAPRYAVVVIGAGHCGLAMAARLRQLKIECLIIDTEERIGDNWRCRYGNLVLHDPVWYNHLPYLPFPENWPIFTRKDDIADWLENYAKIMKLNVSVNTTLQEAKWNGSQWSLQLVRRCIDGPPTMRTVWARHVIQATGQAGRPSIPMIPGVSSFQGVICHSATFSGAPPSDQGKSAVVIGSGNSAHDIAQDYHDHGWKVTMIQRSATTVDLARYEHNKGLYREGGLSTRDADLVTQSLPTALLKTNQIEATKQMRHENLALFTKLEAQGFQLDWGSDNSGRKLQYLMRGGGYYINTGTSSVIASGSIKIVSNHQVSRILPHGLLLSSITEGSCSKPSEVVVSADHIVLCTGHQSIADTTRSLFGDKVADIVGPVWGLDGEGELRRVWRPTGVRGLWIVGGNFKAARWGVETLGLLIKALELGLCDWSDLGCI